MNPVYDYSGQAALITGASSGMGLATAQAFAAAGASVALVDLNTGRGFRPPPTPLTNNGRQAIADQLRRGETRTQVAAAARPTPCSTSAASTWPSTTPASSIPYAGSADESADDFRSRQRRQPTAECGRS